MDALILWNWGNLVLVRSFHFIIYIDCKKLLSELVELISVIWFVDFDIKFFSNLFY